MTKVLINFANIFFSKSQKYNAATGLSIGGFDRVISYRPQDIDREFFEKNRWLLSHPKGAGYWLWKPYFIKKTLNLLQDGDFLMYCDAGSHFICSVDPLIQTCQIENQDIIPFDAGLIEKIFTKRDTFILMNCDTSIYINTVQRQASFILFKKSKLTSNFLCEYLHYAQDERIITDLENQMGAPNYPEFKEHRHDQSIFSLLTKQYNLVGHRDPSQWGNGGEQAYPHSQYGQIIQHTRTRNRSMALRSLSIARQFLYRLRHRPHARNTYKTS